MCSLPATDEPTFTPVSKQQNLTPIYFITQASTGRRREHEDPNGEYTSIAASATLVLPQTLGQPPPPKGHMQVTGTLITERPYT